MPKVKVSVGHRMAEVLYKELSSAGKAAAKGWAGERGLYRLPHRLTLSLSHPQARRRA